jgi:hypothetical protein
MVLVAKSKTHTKRINHEEIIERQRANFYGVGSVRNQFAHGTADSCKLSGSKMRMKSIPTIYVCTPLQLCRKKGATDETIAFALA